MEPTTTLRPSGAEKPAPTRVTTESIAAAFAAARAAMRDGKGRRRFYSLSRFIAADGTRLARVPLTGGFTATVDADDYDLFIRLGLSTRWLANDNGKGRRTVRFCLPPARAGQRSNNASVSRVILGAGYGERVRYRDGNPLNLTRANLYVVPGFAKGRERATVRSMSQGDGFSEAAVHV